MLTISPDATPKDVKNAKHSDQLKLFEEAFWLADLYLVPRTYTILDDKWKSTNCMMCGALATRGNNNPLCGPPKCASMV